jgi:serpin B
MFTDPSPSKLLRVGATCGVALLLSCSDSTGPADPGPITELPRALSQAERDVLAGSNDFAFDLAAELLPEGPDENLFWSPLSASMLLGMVLNGTDGDTFDQIRAGLGFEGMTQAQINEGYRDLIDLLTTLDPSVTVELANSTWARMGYPILPDFQQRLTDFFSAEAREVDFGDPATLAAINGWVDEATHGRIEKIFDQLPAGAVMVLLNAIYFQGDWTTQFDEDLTAPASFTRSDGSTVTADLMSMDDTFLFGRYGGVAVVDLPYGGEAFSMTLAVPDAGLDVTEVVAGLTPEIWRGWIEGLAETRVAVGLPRFELEWKAELNDPLKALGMTDAFDAGLADFSRLVEGGGPWLSLVKQKAFVKVDEKGTEAAAVTGGVVVDSAPPQVRADRPFLFVLRERLTGTILFMGVVNDPTA